MKYVKWVGQALDDLLNLPIATVAQKYGHSSEYVRTARYRAKKKLSTSPKELPVEQAPPDDSVRRISELLERSNIDPNDVERVNQVRVGTYQMLTKNNEGEAEIHDLEVTNVAFTPRGTEQDTANAFITQAAPTVIRPLKPTRPDRGDQKLTVCLGDAQIGYRGNEPFHDERAMALAQLAIRLLQPDNVVFTGDMIDLPSMSRFEQRGDWQQTTQSAIDRYHKYLAETRANAPDANIVVVHGNHELRMDSMIRRDAAPLLGIRRANADRELGVLTLQYLVRYDELGVTSVDGYPNAAHWLEDNLKVTHGTNVAKGGSNAAKYLQQEATSTIFGHTHRLEVAHRTIPARDGHETIVAASPGCLARIDGAVPGHRYSVSETTGDTVLRAEDWQQGIVIALHSPQGHSVRAEIINEQGINLNGKQYNL